MAPLGTATIAAIRVGSCCILVRVLTNGSSTFRMFVGWCHDAGQTMQMTTTTTTMKILETIVMLILLACCLC